MLVIPNPRLGAGEESAFELSVHDSRITIHGKDQIPHPKEARIRDDRARAKGRLGAVACHSEPRLGAGEESGPGSS